ncbi:glycerophosphodiester phosphodiesterase [Gayadomonas joobiniege]|uniref:glycerophosphodiester phosphodiesterase n=1 Tax=Gayadomonas joobiniege TaxID=1234606 RepID=UPI00035D0C2A|nr:glycerophosphodiester phosphodiesterase [Gayadomonas joobiniege]
MFIWAHRGASGTHDENTLAAFEAAIDRGADGIEMDVQIYNGQPIVLHEPWLERTTGIKKYLDELSEAEFVRLTTRSGEPVPTLRQALQEIAGRCRVNLEIKAPNCESIVLAEINRQIELGVYQDSDFLISSFDHHMLARMYQLAPHLHYSALISHIPLQLQAVLSELPFFAIHCDVHFINRELVEQAHAAGLKVNVYTVNRPREKEWVTTLKVDGYFTDFP